MPTSLRQRRRVVGCGRFQAGAIFCRGLWVVGAIWRMRWAPPQLLDGHKFTLAILLEANLADVRVADDMQPAI